MSNINITTQPTGRSPENKYFFGNLTKELDLSRPKYNKIGNMEDFNAFYNQLTGLSYKNRLRFKTVGISFLVFTNDDRHAQFVRNMFNTEDEHDDGSASDWIIFHNTEVELSEPKIHVNLDHKIMLIGGTTFLGEIKKGVFGIVSFELPKRNTLPMHCSAFTYKNTTNLMFGLSGTGKTTLSSDPDFRLIGDDEIAWSNDGIHMIESGCYAKSEGLTPETHETIFNAVENARNMDCLVIENPGVPNARLSYPITMVDNAYHEEQKFDHATNIFFLAMDAEAMLPALSIVKGDTARLLFETGYTSQMPGTEAGVDKIQKIYSPCYGSPFMPRRVREYSDMLMDKIEQNDCTVFLLNTGMGSNGKRFPLELTRNSIKTAITDKLDTRYIRVKDSNFSLCMVQSLNNYTSSELLPADSQSSEYKEKLKNFKDNLEQVASDF